MRTITVRVIASAVLSCALISASALHAATPRKLPSCGAIQHVQLSEGVSLVRLANGVDVERLTGDAALAHLRNLMSRNPAAFAQSRKDLLARGFKPTETVFVERTLRQARSRWDQARPFQYVQDYSESNSDGEIVFWSWTDGDDDTWEGSIYVTIYSNGAETTWDGQIYDATEDHPWVWYQKTYERQPIDKQIEYSAPPLPGRGAEAIQLARLGQPMWKPEFLPAGSFYNWSVCWRSAVVGGCTTAAVACRLSGPAWPGCFGAWCVGAEVGGAIGCYFAN